MIKRQVGEQRVYLAYTSYHHLLLKEVSLGTQTGPEPGTRADVDAIEGWGVFYWLAHCLLRSLIEPKTTSPGMAPPTMG